MSWIELREPGCTPVRKGPFKEPKHLKAFLIELFNGRKSALVTVMSISTSGPDFQDGPECLEMMDRRYRGLAARHRANTAEAWRALMRPERRIRKVKYLAIIALGMLTACSCPPHKAESEPGKIKNISFRGAHEYDDCGAKRGCRSVYVPDTWYVNVCDDAANGSCRVLSMTHAPWNWQTEGRPITLNWETYCSWGNQYWRVRSYAELKAP